MTNNKLKLKTLLLVIFSLVVLMVSSTGKVLAATPADGTPCPPNDGVFFGLYSWDHYLKDHFYYENGICGFHENFLNTKDAQQGNDNSAQVTGINGSNLSDLWLIGLAVFEDLLRVAGFIAVGVVIFGGIRYMTSAGDPSTAKGAQQTILNALIGLAIAIIAAATVQFIGNQLGG